MAGSAGEPPPLLYGWKAIHRWFRERGVQISFRTLRDKWGKLDGFPVSRPDFARDVVADPEDLEKWVRSRLLA